MDLGNGGMANSTSRHNSITMSCCMDQASFHQVPRGERFVPLKYIKKHCSHHFKCHEVNEFRTSQICPDCKKCRLDEVIKSSPGMMTQSKIRGLKWCTSKEYKHNPLKNRDMVGSINIMKKGLNVENPNSLFSKEKVPWSHHTPNAHMIYYPPKVMAKRE